MTDVDELVQRTVRSITSIASKASRFAGKVLIAAIVICVGSFYLGIEALSGGIETVWIVLGIVFGAIAIGGAAVAVWRAYAVKRHVPQLADEVRALAVDGRPEAQTVIETFEVGDAEAGGSAIVMSRQLGGSRASLGPALSQSKRLYEATRAMTMFPFQMLATVLITMVFAFLGLIFLLALAL
jgi:hypothetical protein